MTDPSSPARPNECLRVAQIRSGAPVDDGEALLITLEVAGGREIDVVLSHELGPPLQRLVGIVANKAAEKRANAGVHETRVTAERIARIELVLSAPEGDVLVRLATQNGYPVAFALPQALVAELADRLVEQIPGADPGLRH